MPSLVSDEDTPSMDESSEEEYVDFVQARSALHHVELACGEKMMRSVWKRHKSVKLDASVSRSVEALARDMEAVKKRRRCALAHWRMRAEALEPARRRAAAAMPPRMAATHQRLHLPLFEEMLHAAGHGDVELISDLRRGFPLTGEMGAGGVGRPAPGGVCTGGRHAQTNAALALWPKTETPFCSHLVR